MGRIAASGVMYPKSRHPAAVVTSDETMQERVIRSTDNENAPEGPPHIVQPIEQAARQFPHDIIMS